MKKLIVCGATGTQGGSVVEVMKDLEDWELCGFSRDSNGKKTSNSRSKVFGHFLNALCPMVKGDMVLSRKESERATGVALDPFFFSVPKVFVRNILLHGRSPSGSGSKRLSWPRYFWSRPVIQSEKKKRKGT